MGQSYFRSASEQQTDVDPRETLIGHFRPELVNRIDEVVVFKHLGKPELRRIVDTHLRQPLARELLRRPGEVGSVRVFVEGAVLKLAWS